MGGGGVRLTITILDFKNIVWYTFNTMRSLREHPYVAVSVLALVLGGALALISNGDSEAYAEAVKEAQDAQEAAKRENEEFLRMIGR